MKEILQNKNLRRTIAAGVFVSAASSAMAATIGHWRLEEGVDGNNVVNAIEFGGNTAIDANIITGTPTYSSNVPNKPGFAIFDGTNPVPLSNTLSIYSGNSTSATAKTPHNAVLDVTDFTMEFFLSITSDPSAFGAAVKRATGATSRMNFDFDHAGNSANFGQTRIFTTNGASNTLGRFGQIYVDTPSNDDNPASYTGGDPHPQGNGIDDHIDVNGGTGSWHHHAITYDSGANLVTLYLDGALVTSFNPDGGMPNPSSGWEFGRSGGNSGDYYVDEIRLSNTILDPSEFLHIAPIPEPSTYAAMFGAVVFAIAAINRRRKI